ncbi:MAG: terminase large subunit [Candidatus Paceibacterota bacterium]
MKTTTVFSKNIQAYNQFSGTGTLIANQGGQGSSKTISLLQLIYLIGKYKEKLITIGSYALPHLKAGAMHDFDKILIGEGIYPDSVANFTESKYYIGKSIIEFVGIEGNEARVTGPRRDILYINEANKRIRYDVFDLANSRTADCTFIDFNPSREFWFHEKIMPSLPYHLIKSNFYDNEYLPERERLNILSKKDKPGFENWFKVYGLGELGQLEDAILTNWEYGEFDTSLPFGYGLDFGSRHPDGMVKCAVNKAEKKIYWKEEIYQNELSTDSLYNLIVAKGVSKKLIVADSAATRTIQDLKGKGLNIKPVIKSPIVDDIKMLWDYQIIVDPESKNLVHNLNNWLWLDKKGEIPMDIEDDLIDAGRYISKTFIKPITKPIQHRAL